MVDYGLLQMEQEGPASCPKHTAEGTKSTSAVLITQSLLSGALLQFLKGKKLYYIAKILIVGLLNSYK